MTQRAWPLRWGLHTANICEKLGIAIPVDMTLSVDWHTELAGPDCPFCAERGVIPAEGWHAPGEARPTGVTRSAQLHAIPTCPFGWMRVHRAVRKDKALSYLFDKIVDGVDPSIATA